MNYTAETYNNINPTLFYSGAFCFGVDPRREQYAGEDVAGVEVPDYKTKYEALQNVIKDNYQLFEVDYYGVDNDNYVDGEGFCCEPKTQSKNARSLPAENVDYEKLQYYYHSDHLGSASYITNLDGEVVQHIEYVPFGEVFLEERNNTWNTPFLFNAKELDEETGLYYYGARYYNPRISLWYGVDPLAEKYPGVSAYAYCVNNPVMLIDPDGMDIWEIDGEGNAKFTNDGKAEVTVNGSPISKFNFTGNERAYAQMGNHYANYNVGGLSKLQNSSVSVINLKEGSENQVVGGYNLSTSFNYEHSDSEARMFVEQGENTTLNMVLNDGYVPGYYDNKYNFINDVVHERGHVIQNENYGAWGELIAIQKQTLHYSWSKTTGPYRKAIENYAGSNMVKLLASREYMTNPQWVNSIKQMYDYMHSKGFDNKFKKEYDWQGAIKYHSFK